VKHRFPLLALALLYAITSVAEIRLPEVISDHAVFQANCPVAIWGWSKPAETVKVTFIPEGDNRRSSFAATTNAKGRWSGKLAAFSTGTAGKLLVSAEGEPDQVVNDVVFGEVWLGSGQSNMEYDIAGIGRTDLANSQEVEEVQRNVATARKEADEAAPPIRYFKVTLRRASEPIDDVKGSWRLANSQNVPRFSAVAWNFAVTLQNALHAPVGVIVSSVGNTPIETWMSKPPLSATSVGPAVYQRNKVELAEAPPDKVAQYVAALGAWRQANPTPELQSQHQSTKPVAPANLSADNYVPNQYFNGMIAGLQPYTIRGVVWYQGAGNMAHPMEYGEMFVALIREWRLEWEDPKLPFLFVEESNFGGKQTAPVEENPFSLIREQQHFALSLPDVGMVGSIDLGNGNPHYPKKKPVGERLAKLALHDIYHEEVGQVLSPIYVGYTVEGKHVRLDFRNADGLRGRGNAVLQGFAIRGERGEWVWAAGRIQGNEIVLWNETVKRPVAVRYAWAVNPITSVENGAGLPLLPFRTDGNDKN